MHHDKPNRIVGRFREPPARQLLRNTKFFCANSSGYRERVKAAPLQGSDRIGSTNPLPFPNIPSEIAAVEFDHADCVIGLSARAQNGIP
jgi:hypothetical protein